MKSFNKLALVSAIAMTSFGAFAMEAIDDASLAATTGQDGITIKVILPDFAPTAATAAYASNATLAALQTAFGGTNTGYKGIAINEVRIHDADGISVSTNSGALVIGGGGVGVDGSAIAAADDKTEIYTNEASPLTIDIDQVGGATPMLNVKITTPTLQIKTGAIYVADSNATATDDGTTVANNTKAIMSGMTLTLGATELTVQLGAAETQGHQIFIDTTMTGGISIDNFQLNDNAGTIKGGSVTVGTLKMLNANGSGTGTALTVKVYADVGSRSTNAALVGLGLEDLTNGMVLTLDQLGDATNGVDMAMNNVALGDTNAAVLGDIQILGLNLNGTEVVISGH